MIGTLLNERYRIDAELGHGGMGVVYRAHDTLLDRDVVVKVLSTAALSDERRARLLREAQATAQLNHPNIIGVYDAGQAEGVPFIVMELVEGESLFDRKPQSLDGILAITRQICAALEHAHAHGIVHRDLKPENVLIAQDGAAKLMDFGLARSSASRLSAEGAIVGTVFYLAPEQALGQPIDGRADLYALGVMLYELTTGRLPFTGEDPLTVISQHLHAPVVPPRTHRADLPPAFEAIILKLLAKDPADRFASAREVALALSGAAEAERPKPVRPLPNNLPIQLSSFIGRTHEIAEVKRLLSTSRLVTLTGTGGSGKTRLALQVATELLDASTFPDGVWLIELAPLSGPELVPRAVGSVLGVREQPGRLLVEALSDHLRSKQLLLVLDNCEHLIEACAQLAETLLRTCSSLKILATSREAIGIAGEVARYVPTLSVPDPQHLPPLADLVAALNQYEAVRLFVDRAMGVQPTFTLTDQNALAVAQICCRLDGIPLAIELAAARMKALSAEQIVARLDDRLNLLTVGSRTALPRHQTLRATIDWSYALLSEAERVLLGRLSVFANGWTLEAAEAICADSQVQPSARVACLLSSEVLDLLTRLVDKSLAVVEEQGGKARYRLLETLRQYAREKLGESGERAMMQTRHLEFFRKLAQEAEPQLRGSEQITWLDQLETEHDNLRAALDWSLESGETEAGLELAGNLSRFWYLRNHWSEGRERLERVLSAGSNNRSEFGRPGALQAETQTPDDRATAWARAKALLGVGWLADESGEEEKLYAESLALCRQVEDRWGAAFSLRGLGTAALNRDDYEHATTLLDESLTLFRELGDPWGIALALFSQGWLAFDQDDHSRAEAVWGQGLALFRQAGDRWGIAVTLGALGYVARARNDFKLATKLSKESLNLFQELGDKAGIASSLSRLGTMAFRREDLKQATALYEESLALQKEVGYKRDNVHTISLLALLACYQGDYQQATTLFNENLAQWRELGIGWGFAMSLDNLALTAFYQGDDVQAAALWEECLEQFRKESDKDGIAAALYGLGRVAHRRGDYRRAKELLDESLALSREMGEKHSIATALDGLGRMAHSQGDYARAAAFHAESLTLRREAGAKRGIAESLEGLAGVLAAAQDQPAVAEKAARLLGAAEAVRETIGAPLPPVERSDHDRHVAAVHARLSEEAFAAAWAKGRAMTLEQAIVYVQEETLN